MSLDPERRINTPPDDLDEWPEFMATTPPATIAKALPFWLYDAVHRESAAGTLTFVRFSEAVKAAVSRLYHSHVDTQPTLEGLEVVVRENGGLS